MGPRKVIVKKIAKLNAYLIYSYFYYFSGKSIKKTRQFLDAEWIGKIMYK